MPRPAPTCDRERRARARERLGFAAWLAGDTATSIQLLEEAVALLDGTPPSTAQSRVLAGLAANLMLAGRSSDSIPVAERAIEHARTTGDRGIESRATGVLGVDRATLGDIAGGIELLRRSLAMASPADDPLAVPRAHANLGSVLEMGGFVEEALEVSLAGAKSIQDYGNELSFRTFLEVNAAAYLIELGRYPEAAELLEVNVARALPGIARIHLNVTQAHLAIRTGDLPAARGYLGVARGEMGGVIDAQFVTDLHTFGTEIALWDNDPAGALDIAREGFDRLSAMDDAIIVGQLAIPAVHAAADLAVRARAGRDRAAAERAVAEAVDVIEGYRAATERLSDARRDRRARDRLAHGALRRGAGACRGARTARPTGSPSGRRSSRGPRRSSRRTSCGGPPRPWPGRGETAAAAEPLREGYAVAARIGARLLVAGMAGLGRRLRLDLEPPSRRRAAGAARCRSTRSRPPADPFGLTAREREVLALVAEGYTNRRIADELFISDSTAGVHVSNILGKLGVESRTEAATIAVRLGLDSPQGGG